MSAPYNTNPADNSAVHSVDGSPIQSTRGSSIDYSPDLDKSSHYNLNKNDDKIIEINDQDQDVVLNKVAEANKSMRTAGMCYKQSYILYIP